MEPECTFWKDMITMYNKDLNRKIEKKYWKVDLKYPNDMYGVCEWRVFWEKKYTLDEIIKNVKSKEFLEKLNDRWGADVFDGNCFIFEYNKKDRWRLVYNSYDARRL